ncbi:hypothetical protein C8A03DRAFT_34407 [Achaetomium macrosporum]|uniref:Fucose-specific lectin n=1 Tax=Achaetomium macrosporum TaxID=79813 RepID=A0AAN7HDK6_9PEZI|nr:hypothetical protein C8A03DRAFT_34407 [Achaetomium macrosporum]
MDLRLRHGGLDGQPGLELVHQVGLEVAAQEHLPYGQSLPEVRADEYTNDGKILTPVVAKYPDQPDPEFYSTPGPNGPQGSSKLREGWRKRKRLWLVLISVGAVVVILAIVLGAVLGSRATRSSSTDSAPASQTASSDSSNNNNSNSNNTTSGSNTTTTAKPQSIRQGSSLSVTGWRKPDGNVETYLFYQDPQDGLRYSKCDTSHRTPGNDSSCWEAPVSFNSYAKAGTPLAASTILWSDQYQPQIALFYSGFKTRLLGVNFNEQFTPPVSESSVNSRQIFTILDGALAAYWPWTLYQDSAGSLFHVRNLLGGSFAPSDTTWDDNPTNVTALPASRLAVVPLSANFSRIAVKGGYAVFYQAPDARLAVNITDLYSPELAEDYPLSWPPTALPAITLPRLAPMAGFSVARAGDPLRRVDTYLLYLDAEKDINVVYTDASAGAERVEWKTARPAALRGADPDTDIACLTMATSFHNAAEAEVHLEEASDATRCYFQRGGVVVEVRLDKGDWTVVGSVPIP